MYRNSVFKNYAGYFGTTKKEDKEETKTKSKEFNYDKYMWNLMVLKLVKELNLTPNKVYVMNYIDCLNWLSLLAQIDKNRQTT